MITVLRVDKTLKPWNLCKTKFNKFTKILKLKLNQVCLLILCEHLINPINFIAYLGQAFKRLLVEKDFSGVHNAARLTINKLQRTTAFGTKLFS